MAAAPREIDGISARPTLARPVVTGPSISFSYSADDEFPRVEEDAMFLRCKLLLNQNGNTEEVLLEKVTASFLRDGFTFVGAFSSTGGGIAKERKVWIYAVTKFELTLMDSGGPGVGMIGGGLGFGELAALPASAILSRALLTDRGIEANDPTGVGLGTVQNGADISVAYHRGPMTWQLTSFQKRGAGGWFTP
jgi:hypothetical protein